MALDRSTHYTAGRWGPPDTDQPQGAFLNETALDADDRSYFDEDWMNDIGGFLGKILNAGSVVPNGVVDSGTTSQIFDAMISVINDANSTSAYLGKSLSGAGLITQNSGAFQAIIADDGSNSRTQGPVYDYGSSDQTIVIPAGITHGYFRYTVNPINDGSLANATSIVGDITVSLFKNGVREIFTATGYLDTNGVIAAAKGTISVVGEIIAVTATESYDLRIIMDATSGGADPGVYMNFEFIPVFDVTII